MATDVTEEESINTGIQRTNSLLEAANRELRDSLDHVQEVARNEAIVAMKARIHDTTSGSGCPFCTAFWKRPTPRPKRLPR